MKRIISDIQSLNLIKTHLNLICSFFDIDVNKSAFNHIFTINNSARSIDNGFANFNLFAQQVGSAGPSSFKMRVLPRVFNDRLTIPAKRITNYINAENIIFAKPGEEDVVFIAQADPFTHKQEWLLKPQYRKQEEVTYSDGNIVTNYVYNIGALLYDRQICEVLSPKFNAENEITVFLGGDIDDINSRVRKPYYDYNIDMSNIKFVQYDPRTSRSCYYCFGNMRYTEILGTFSGIVKEMKELSDLNESAIYQRLTRAYNKTCETGKAYKFTIPAKKEIIGNCMFDQRMIEDRNIILYVSSDKTFDVIDNKVEYATENMTAYKKIYNKVNKYSKTHSEPKASWTDEEKELFWKITK